MTDDALFPLPKVPPLPVPRSPARATGRISYARHTAKHRYKCDDCLRVLLEATLEGKCSPLARQAQFSRTQRGQRLYLCSEHKELRERAETMEQAAAEVRRALGA